jgi:hypothetical protein
MGALVSEEAFLLHNDATRMLRRWSRKRLVEDVKERMESPGTIIDASKNKFFIEKKPYISFLEKFMNLICCKNFD